MAASHVLDGSDTGDRLIVFDLNQPEMARAVLLHPELGDMNHVKSIGQHPTSGTIAHVKGEDGHWWSENLCFTHSPDALHVPGEHFYRVRWNVRIPQNSVGPQPASAGLFEVRWLPLNYGVLPPRS